MSVVEDPSLSWSPSERWIVALTGIRCAETRNPPEGSSLLIHSFLDDNAMPTQRTRKAWPS